MASHLIISQLPPADPPDGNELVPVVQRGFTKRMALSSWSIPGAVISSGQASQLAYYDAAGVVKGLSLGVGFTIAGGVLNYSDVDSDSGSGSGAILGGVQGGQANQLAYYDTTGNVVKGLSLGVGFTIAGGVLSYAGTGSGLGPDAALDDTAHAAIDDLGITISDVAFDDLSSGQLQHIIAPLVGDGVTDDAAILRGLLGHNRLIIIPPGVWTFKSRIVPASPVTYQCSTSVLLQGLRNCHVTAYGAKFICDNSISGPDATHLNSGMSHVGFQGDCHNCSWSGGEIVGNRTGLPSGTLNSGIWFESVTDLVIRDVVFSGDYTNGSAINGVYAFDSRFEGNRGINVALPFDTSHLEACTISGNTFYRGTAIFGSTGIKVFTDTATVSDNVVTSDPGGTSRSIRNGQTNDVRVTGNRLVGYPTGIFVDGVAGIFVAQNTIRDGLQNDNANGFAGITIGVSPESFAAGIPTRDVVLEDNDITNCGNTGLGPGAGILIASNNHPLQNLTIRGGRIYDNARAGVGPATVSSVTGLRIINVDFRSTDGSGRQTAGVDAAMRFFLGVECFLAGCVGDTNDSIKADQTTALISSLGTSYLWNDGTNQAARQSGTFYVQNVAGSAGGRFVAGAASLGTDGVNFLAITGNGTGFGGNVTATGGDANIDVNLLPKGAGRLRSTNSSVLVRSLTMGGLPTTANIIAGEAAVVKDTAGGTVKLYYNDGGALKSVALA